MLLRGRNFPSAFSPKRWFPVNPRNTEKKCDANLTTFLILWWQSFPRYEMSNCLYEATLQKVEKLCGCTSPQFLNEDLEPYYHVCNATRRKCMNNLLDLIGNERTIDDEGVTKPCLAACENQKHNFFVTSAGYPNIESFHLVKVFPILIFGALFHYPTKFT